ncbi:hypothetical protein DEO72_LG1g1810 [Vigna unguiculata]|uniref:Uncharacterized protein n=1 Tax=Vigna unguiculata TaxID=3917 RepID=A0A4D6KKY7_VIGUN|nr:hypothetical protein DEO72_LG1g1810 [Vigna unguiculata]
MGNSFNKHVDIELSKWSTTEFPQEYVLVYTSLDDPFRTSAFRLSANTDMVLCRLAGDMCKKHPVRCRVNITALRDSRGDCRFGEVAVSQQGDEDPSVEESPHKS